RLRRAYETLPNEVNEQIFRLIEEAAARWPSVTFLRVNPAQKGSGEELLQSHVRGVPYAEAGDEWPADSKFLLQVRLQEAGLGKPWQGLLFVAFFVFDSEQPIRSYAAPSHEKYVPLPAPVAPAPSIRLTSVRMPMMGEDEKFPASPARLC